MGMQTPMEIHFYDENSEIEKTFVRTFVPWKVLKKAIRFYKEYGKIDMDDPEAISEDLMDAISSLVIEAFGGQFTTEDIDNKVDTNEMMVVMNLILQRANGISGNPTPPGK